MFDIGFSELLLVGVVALLVFGPERLPELARNGALWLGRLRRAMRDAKQSIKDELGTDEIMQQLHNEEVLRKLGEDPNRLSRPAPPPAPPVTTAHDPANERH
ncbi:MAG: twin-arginine translocase subunit TatB [Pseudomonadales bacterium]|jgi:sec-independent protein translocase protein TatB|nr:twin-arginine translocase subunit TatB [Pseudomonadales bacterium]MCP5332828.1 twin-arginine translocase subunit TatB [Pseudomonadales bacterium]HMU89366.1 Sec-independent protein translocase protein TatB [Pseudomonadales bacterium]HMW15264.1 Sec-independent protein translocase protein TatB [Pseudomonadales bacterium]HMW82631.1 Sec-independent protein translocase protein TatB [Pseudomonadales bacterium]